MFFVHCSLFLQLKGLTDIQDVLAGGILKGMTVHVARQEALSVAFQCMGSARVRQPKT